MPDLSQNQIRRWYWAYLQLLQCKMLCKMWRKSGITVKQGMHFTNTVMAKKCATETIVILLALFLRFLALIVSFVLSNEMVMTQKLDITAPKL